MKIEQDQLHLPRRILICFGLLKREAEVDFRCAHGPSVIHSAFLRASLL
jgi:hypothetical protein